MTKREAKMTNLDAKYPKTTLREILRETWEHPLRALPILAITALLFASIALADWLS